MEKVRGRALGGGGSLPLPEHSGGVIVQVVHGALPDVSRLGKNVVVGNHAGQFEVAVGDGAVPVAAGLERPLDVPGEGHPPQQGSEAAGGGRNEKDATHASVGRVARAEGGRGGGHRLGDASRAGLQLAGQPAEVIKEIMDVGIEAKAMVVNIGALESHLQGTEQAARTGNGQDHGAKFANDLVPGLLGDAFGGAGQGKEDGMEPGDPAGGEGDGRRGGVDDPPQDCFGGSPGAIPF